MKRIESDVYNISKRVKDIDIDYYVVFNTITSKFEVHNSNQFGGSYCLTLPFKELDERTLNYINITKSENIEEILCKIEKENKIRESAAKSSAFSNVYENLQDLEM